MKNLLLLLTLFSFQGSSHAQATCDIAEHYGDFIKARKQVFDDREFLVKQVTEVVGDPCYAEVVNSNLASIDYLLTNFSSNANYQALLGITDSLALQREFIRSLQLDSTFNAVMADMVLKTVGAPHVKDTITNDQLLSIAVKFFSIIRINEDGNYVGKVCVGLNDIKSTEKIRLPHVEAFCFSSILKNYQGDEYNMYDEFVKAIKQLYKVNLGIDRHENLLRAQGAMFLQMKLNPHLSDMLLHEYEMNQQYLPFVLKTE